MASIDVTELLRSISAEEDHVSAVELARWIRAGRPGLRVVDVRSADEFAAYHIPGAEHVPIDRLTSAPLGRDETIVLYSDRGVHGGQAWVLLRALGHRRVYFLRDGIHEWLDGVMHPTIAEGATSDARAAFAAAAELSRYFGGSLRTDPGGAHTAAASPSPGRWRGC